MRNLADISYYKELEVLVDLPEKIPGFIFNVTGRNADDRLVARPELIYILELIGSKFESIRKKELLLNSVLRPENQQASLRKERLRQRKNGKDVTIPARPGKSFHPTGAAADISMRNLNSKDKETLRRILRANASLGLITYLEEGYPRHFHIVSKIREVPRQPVLTYTWNKIIYDGSKSIPSNPPNTR